MREKSRCAERMKPKICPTSSPFGLHLLEWGLSPILTQFGMLGDGSIRKKSFYPSFHVVAKVAFACFKSWGHIF